MKRLKKILKWTGIVLGGLAAALLIANAILVWTTGTRLERQLAAIREAGDPLVLTDLAHPPIPPEENAATYLRRAQEDVGAIGGEYMMPELVSLRKQRRDMPYPLPSKVQTRLKAAFDTHPKAIPLLAQAAACPDYDPQFDYSVSNPEELITGMLPRIETLRANALVLQLRVWLLVAEGKHDEAARTALLIFRLARHFDRNPTLTGYLVAIVVREYAIQSTNEALQTGPVSKEVRDALDSELALQERMEGFAWTIKSDRPYVLAYFDTVPRRNFWLYSRWCWNLEESEFLEMMEAFLALPNDARPFYHVKKTIHKVNGTFSPTSGPFAQQLFPTLEATYQAVLRTRAKIRCLRVLNALQTHIAAGDNKTPKLTDLGLPAETTTDPFTGGEPLHVKKLPQGWLVYSIGGNDRDDGGNLEGGPNGDIGVGPPPPAKNP